MNYTTEDLAKIKQLVATEDMNNVKIGIQIAKGLGVTPETLASLFTIDDIVTKYNTNNGIYFLNAFGYDYSSYLTKKYVINLYKMSIKPIISQLLNE